MRNPKGVEGGSRPWNGDDLPARSAEYTKEPKAFVEICLACTRADCQPHARDCPLAIYRRREMDIPQDLETLAQSMTAQAIADHYGVSKKRVRAWFQARGIVSRSGRRFRAVPPGFRELYRDGVGISKLRKIFRAGDNTVTRWIREIKKEENHE